MTSSVSPSKRLDALRSVFATTKAILNNGASQSRTATVAVDAYLVGTADAHQSEYVSSRDQRRSFISGFTGSAGTALITKEQALLWTDGRYFVQAQQQLSDSWTLMRSGEPNVPTLEEWVSSKLPSGSKVAVDPFLTSVSLWKKLQKAVKGTGVLVVEQSTEEQGNLVDQIWSDQPSEANGAVTMLEEKYTGASVEKKLEKLRSSIKAKGAGAIILTALDDIAWLFNLRGTDIEFNPVVISYALVTLDSATLYINKDKLSSATIESFERDGLVSIQPYEVAVEQIKSYGAQTTSKILLDTDQCNVAVYNSIPESLRMEERSLVLVEKTRKNKVELEGLRQAHIRDGAALVRFFSWLEDQMGRDTVELNEVTVADMEQKFREQVQGFVSLSFDTISSVGANGAIIHYKPETETCAKMDKNQMYLNDSGGQYLDGTTDVTRTVHFGTPTQYEKECFTRVLKGHIALATVKFPENTEGVKLDTVARLALWQAGLDYQHGTGHGVGAFLNVHEKGVLLSSRLNPTGLSIGKGMVISNEPGYYETGKFGIRIESVMIINEVNEKFCECETITMAPIQRSLIDISLLTSAEIQWVDQYHEKVRKTLLPLLKTANEFESMHSSNAVEYLLRETSPLQ